MLCNEATHFLPIIRKPITIWMVKSSRNYEELLFDANREIWNSRQG